MNPDIDRLQAYPFERLAPLKQGATPPPGLSHIALSIGEPRHPAPAFVVDALRNALDGLGSDGRGLVPEANDEEAPLAALT